jgi:hypothetical protein
MSEKGPLLSQPASSADRSRVGDMLRRTLEGELVALAVAPEISAKEGGHSKSHGSGSHSKCGHQHSKGTVPKVPVVGEPDGSAYAQFADAPREF